MVTLRRISIFVAFAVIFGVLMLYGQKEGPRVERDTLLFDFDEGFEVAEARSLGGAEIALTSDLSGKRLRVTTSHLESDPGVLLPAPRGQWNLEQHRAVEVDVHNPAVEEIWVYGRIESDGVEGCSENLGSVLVPPGASRTLHILFRRLPPEEGSALDRYFIGMRGACREVTSGTGARWIRR